MEAKKISREEFSVLQFSLVCAAVWQDSLMEFKGLKLKECIHVPAWKMSNDLLRSKMPWRRIYETYYSSIQGGY